MTEKFLRRPKTARGLYLDRRPEHEDVHMRFVYAEPDRWVWLHEEEPADGAITDGTTNVIVDEGVAVVVTNEGEVGTTNRLENLLRPSHYNFSSWELGPVKSGTAIGRAAWLFSATPTTSGKTSHELAFDAESGVILFMGAEGFYLGFEELELDEEFPDGTFRWSGPIESRKIGTALVTPSEDGTYSVIWEISVRGRSVFHQEGPCPLTQDEAVAWGEERAARTHIRAQ